MFRIFFAILFVCFLSEAAGQRMTPEQYIDKYQQLAIDEMKRARIPAAITLAQGILESESGNSVLAQKSNNHFGIKCKSEWTGPTVSHNDDKKGECFRVYGTVKESYRDHSDFLLTREWYRSLFDLNISDYVSWAHGLKQAGYATDPQYAYRLIDIIERYDLNKFTVAGLINVPEKDKSIASQRIMEPQNVLPVIDAEVLNNWFVFHVNGVKAVRASAGTSLLSIASHFHIRLKKLLEMNDLKNDGLLAKTQNIFLEKKKKEGSRLSLINDEQQTLYDISQKEGIQLSSLNEFNRGKENILIAAGEEIFLKPVPVIVTSEKAPVRVPGPTTPTSVHEVAPKEGLYAISKKYGVTVAQLKEWNNLNNDQLQIGQKLIIYK